MRNNAVDVRAAGTKADAFLLESLNLSPMEIQSVIEISRGEDFGNNLRTSYS
jgi:hypothetical protein